MAGDVALVELHFRGFDRQPSTRRHRITSVHREVNDDLLDLCGVSVDARDRRSQVHRQRDVLANNTAEQRFDTPQHPVQIEDLRLQDLPPTEREKLARQARSSVNGRLDLLEVLLNVMGRPEVQRDQLRVAANDHEQVVEVVRDPTGQLPDGFHLLRLAELLLCFPDGRNVLDETDDAADTAVRRANRKRPCAHPADRLVGSANPEHVHCRLALLQCQERCGNGCTIVDVNAIEPDLRIRVGLVDRNAPQVFPHAAQKKWAACRQFDNEECLFDVVGEEPESLFAGPQVLLGKLPIGHVDDRGHRGERAIPRDNRHGAVYPSDRPVATDDPELVPHRGGFPLCPLSRVLGHEWPIFRGDVRPHLLTDHLLGRIEADERGEPLVREPNHPADVDQGCPERRPPPDFGTEIRSCAALPGADAARARSERRS